MIKNIVKLECVIEGKEIELLCDNDTPTKSVKEALFQFLKYVGQVEDQSRAEDPVSPEVKEDPKAE